jgi:hypothetical protein
VQEPSLSSDLIRYIGPVTVFYCGEDNLSNRRKVYRQFRLPKDQRWPGLLKLSARCVACMPAVAREELRQRASGASSLPQHHHRKSEEGAP